MIQIEAHCSEHGAISILRSETRPSVIYMLGDAFQSEADDTGISLASYVHALYGLILQMRARRVLVIGCAGGTLPTMLARVGCTTTAVDINPTAFVFARRYFSLPDSVECRALDGLEFLATTANCFDVIVLDAYEADNIPAHLASENFLRCAKAKLAGDGAVFANVHVLDDADRARNRLAVAASAVWPLVRVLDTPGAHDRNAIVAAGAVGSLEEPELHVLPKLDVDTIRKELAAMRFLEATGNARLA